MRPHAERPTSRPHDSHHAPALAGPDRADEDDADERGRAHKKPVCTAAAAISAGKKVPSVSRPKTFRKVATATEAIGIMIGIRSSSSGIPRSSNTPQIPAVHRFEVDCARDTSFLRISNV